MRRMTRFFLSLLFLGLLAMPGAALLHAQQGRAAGPNEEHMDAPENHSGIEQYRHSAVMQAIARRLHVKTETAAEIFEDFNSGILLFTIFFFLAKMLPKMFRNRSAALRRELVGAREATEDANRRLAEVEARLLRLDTEVEAIRRDVEQEAAGDEKRIHALLEAERERIIASAEQEIAAAQAAAQRELKKFAADLAIDQALRRIQLTADADRRLVRDFGKRLGGGSGGEA